MATKTLYQHDKAIFAVIERLVTKYGAADVVHALNKWSNDRAVKAKLHREKKKIEARLAELEGEGI